MFIGIWPATKLPDHLRAATYTESGACVWLSMALLLHHVGFDSIAKQMSDVLQQRPRLCTWLQSKGLKLEYYGDDKVIQCLRPEQQLRQCIRSMQTNYLYITQLSGIILFQSLFCHVVNHVKWKRVKLTNNGIDRQTWKPEQYLEFLQSNPGYYVGFLSTAKDTAFHAIAIDSTKEDPEVYDPEELYILKLKMEVLDICCGEDKKFKEFAAIYQLVIVTQK